MSFQQLPYTYEDDTVCIVPLLIFLCRLFSDLGNAEHALRLVEKFNSDSGLYYPNSNKKSLKLQDNPWRMPPEAVVERGLEDTKTFLRDVLEAEKVTYLHLLKVVLVGSESVGKIRWEILARLSDYLELKSRTASTLHDED